MIELKKGLIIDEMYSFIVIRVLYDKGKIQLYCLDSHANNIYVLDLEGLQDPKFINPTEFNCSHPSMNIVGEVLAGQHDHRFNHLNQEEK